MKRIAIGCVAVVLSAGLVLAWTHGKFINPSGSGDILVDPANGNLLTDPANGDLLVRP